jgi:sigma54-dependent transcription regulator
MPQTVEQKTSESLLRLIAEGTASVTGDEFFRTLVRYLASALHVRYAFVAEFAGVKTRVRTLAFWSGDCLLDNFEFDLVGTPCEAVLAGEMRLYKQEQEFDRVGGIKTLKVDVRVIAATNRNLLEGMKAGTFRSDLYYRLNVFPLEVPPLRERCPDIPLLARHFLKRFARKLGKPLLDIAPSSMERLERYAWPGNIREL